jgi:hypothetical protein
MLCGGTNLSIYKDKNKLTNDAEELMPYRFQFEPNANKIRKDFVYARI